MEVFPHTSHTGPNIRRWVEDTVEKEEIEYSSISGVTPDGASDGQAAFAQIPKLAEKVDTCGLHQLQTSVLYSVGMAGATTKNLLAKQALVPHRRVVTLSRQSRAVGDGIRQAQYEAGVTPRHMLSLIRTMVTRWGGVYLQACCANTTHPPPLTTPLTPFLPCQRSSNATAPCDRCSTL